MSETVFTTCCIVSKYRSTHCARHFCSELLRRPAKKGKKRGRVSTHDAVANGVDGGSCRIVEGMDFRLVDGSLDQGIPRDTRRLGVCDSLLGDVMHFS